MAIIFDLDGTLVDTLRDIATCMNRVLARAGLPEHEEPRYKHMVGEGVELLVRRALPVELRQPETIARFVASMRSEYGAHWADTSRPYAGVIELLDALRARREPLAVLSNKPHELTEQVVARLLGAHYFAAVYGARPAVPRKPDPTAALQIARQLALPAEQWLYVGDTATDMQTATRARMYAVGALWGFRDAPELQHSGARALLNSPLELLDVLDAGRP